MTSCCIVKKGNYPVSSLHIWFNYIFRPLISSTTSTNFCVINIQKHVNTYKTRKSIILFPTLSLYLEIPVKICKLNQYYQNSVTFPSKLTNFFKGVKFIQWH